MKNKTTFSAFPDIEFPQELISIGFVDMSDGNDANALAVLTLTGDRILEVRIAEEDPAVRELGPNSPRFMVGIQYPDGTEPEDLAHGETLADIMRDVLSMNDEEESAAREERAARNALDLAYATLRQVRGLFQAGHLGRESLADAQGRYQRAEETFRKAEERAREID